MNKKSLSTLEFYKITDQLVSYACCDGAKKILRNLKPMTDITDINLRLDETNDALSRIFQKGTVDFSHTKDIRASVARLKVGSSLNISELLNISAILSCAKHVKDYYEHREDSISGMLENLATVDALNSQIKKCIISEDEISDDASSNLRSIRRSKSIANDRIHSELNKLLNSPTYRTYLQDYVITTRQGRYCLPVKAEYKSAFPGMIHDQSSTGSTLFIEPAAVVKLNNDIRELELKEAAEIEVILADLSVKAGEHTEELLCNYEILVELDCIFAKAQLARHMHASRPVMNTSGIINIKKGRHPLIEPHIVVPIDIYLGTDFKLLIITGPNTGGKTVSLKTVGLLTLMAQSGLFIPALDHSDIAVFKNIYADIGDEQSIEQSLSTFSSHMVNTVSILEKADADSLVLFDELGAGTDPTEGAALATAILSNLHKRGCLVMATTHYSELKLYALQTPDVQNACCEFDVATLQPTYRLLIGIPGKSNAFAISGKLGLSQDIIEDARERVSSDAQNFEDVLSDLEASRIKLEKEQKAITESRKEISRLKKELREKTEKIEQSKEKILQNANQEAGKILAEAKTVADDTIRKYTKWAKSDRHIQEMERERANLRSRMNKHQDLSGSKPQQKRKKKALKAADLMIGSNVHILTLNANGTVSTLPNEKGDLFVQAGLLRTQVNIKDLELLPDEKPKQTEKRQNGSGRIRIDKAASIHQEVNLIGMTVDEAMPVLNKYLDDAYLAHMSQVTVIHGRGTGALRKAVHQQLAKLKYVKSYRLGEFGEGDMGVTIVCFK